MSATVGFPSGWSAWRTRLVATATILATLVAIQGATAPRAHAVSTADLNSWSNWSIDPPGGLYRVDGRMSVTEDPGKAGYYFYATNAILPNGNNTYIGLQNDGSHDAGGNDGIGKLAVFSVWGATGADSNPDGWCVPFSAAGERGSGKSCRIHYDWVRGHVYRTRLDRVPSSTLLEGSVIDETTGSQTFVGLIDTGAEGPLSNVGNFLERFGPDFPDCAGLPLTTVSFYAPVGNDSTVGTLTGNISGPGACDSVRSIINAGDHVEHSMGTNNWGCEFLFAGYTLYPGGFVWTCDGRYLFVHQTDGNVVLYYLTVPYDNATGIYVWDTGTGGLATSQFVMQKDGNLVLYAPDGRDLWWSGTDKNYGAFLKVQADGKLVIYRDDGSDWLWSSTDGKR